MLCAACSRWFGPVLIAVLVWVVATEQSPYDPPGLFGFVAGLAVVSVPGVDRLGRVNARFWRWRDGSKRDRLPRAIVRR